jgi:hypothetical protein
MFKERGLFEKVILVALLAVGLVVWSADARAAMVQQWVASYNGPANGWDCGLNVITDGEGNSYVTGFSSDYADPPDVFTAKYSPAGAQVWAARWGGLTHEMDMGISIALDSEANVYVAGVTTSGGTLDALLLKYDNDGNPVWADAYDGGVGDDTFIRVAVDGGDNIYAVGTSLAGASGLDYLLAKYDADGNLLWVRTNNGPGNANDLATGLAVDAAGNAYVNGSQTTAVGIDAALVKYDAEGAFQWKTLLNGSFAGSLDYGGGAAVNSEGNVYYAAMLQDLASYDIAAAFVDAGNTTSWMDAIDGPGALTDSIPEYLLTRSWVAPGVRGVAVGPGDMFYLVGSVTSVGPNPDIFLAKYNAAGAQQWTAALNSSGVNQDYSAAVAVDADGNAFVGGFASDGAYWKYITAMYDADGTLVNTQYFIAPGARDNMAQNIAVDPDGNPIVTGFGWQGGAEEYNSYTVKYCVGCLIGNVCYPDGALPEDNGCLICDVSVSQTGWSNNDGEACDDGLFCNGADTCAAGDCSEHAGDPCPPDTTCDETTDQCLDADDDTIDDDTTGGGGDDDSGCCGC